MAGEQTIQAALGALVAALNYGARDGFAHLSTLRNLEAVVRAVAAKAGRAGADQALLLRLSRAAAGFDSADPKSRRKSVTEMARALAPVVDLPEELRSLSEEVVYPAVSPGSGPLATPLRELAVLRGRLPESLAERGMSTAGEVLFFFPRAYEDRRQSVPIARLRPGERGVSMGTIRLAGEVALRRRRIFRVVLGDSTGTIAATWFHYQPWMRQRFKIGERYLFSGEVRVSGRVREMIHPEMELVEDLESDPVNFGRIVPIYSGFERGEQRSFRRLAKKVVDRFAGQIEDPLPRVLLERVNLPPLSEAVRQVHFPEGVGLEALLAHQVPAQRRLAFDELFFIQLGMSLRRKGVKLAPGIRFAIDDTLLGKAISCLPFQLTPDQKRVLAEIAGDMAKSEPMNRLLQGDVGSGKTAVAMIAAIMAAENGYQTAFMAPTEILAEQHHRTLSNWLTPAGYRVALLTAGVGKAAKSSIKESMAAGEAQIVVGTHALLQEDVAFRNLGLAVIDEQHRFGVLQRAGLIQKGVRPDVLVMTATPIPRTLAMTLYGDLDVSQIQHLPPGRQPVRTRVFSERQRDTVYELVAQELERGRQAFVIYPLVEESEKIDLASATEGARQLTVAFPRFRVGLLHGRMKVEDKQEVMASFRAGAIRLLVSTTVVEVGVDVPNATVMVVESGERFGLSQLHQLRGRVGRGTERSFCYLVGAVWHNPIARQRLAIMEQTTDGFEIAEKDLALRGPGEFLGTRQSGVPGLTVADLARDQDLLRLAKEESGLLAEADPGLSRPEHAPLRRALDERWEGKLGLGRVG
jgi:ATP-dependent DNA helicase RecG